MSGCKYDEWWLLKKHSASGNLSLSREMSRAHMAETVAFRVHFSGMKLMPEPTRGAAGRW
uniref:Uncharacterized protein n=1 Tax=Romanomermis culicivorax TaxID=13658 RepID=A0A915HRK5_ROMCU